MSADLLARIRSRRVAQAEAVAQVTIVPSPLAEVQAAVERINAELERAGCTSLPRTPETRQAEIALDEAGRQLAAGAVDRASFRAAVTRWEHVYGLAIFAATVGGGTP